MLTKLIFGGTFVLSIAFFFRMMKKRKDVLTSSPESQKKKVALDDKKTEKVTPKGFEGLKKLLVVTEETQSKFLEEKNSQEEYEGIIFSTQPSTKEMMLAFKKLVPGGKIAVKMTNGKANFLNFVMCGFIDIKSDEIEVVANKPKFKIGTSQQLKPKQPENSSPKQSENSTTPNQQEIIIEKKTRNHFKSFFFCSK